MPKIWSLVSTKPVGQGIIWMPSGFPRLLTKSETSVLVNSEALSEGWLEGEEEPSFCSYTWPLDTLYHKATSGFPTLFNSQGTMGV